MPFFNTQAGIDEIAGGLRAWRVWHLLGTADLRRRHARSRIGQLWLTLSSAITIITLGLVWALLWRIPVAGLLPYITVAMILWALIVSILNESTNAFVSMGSMFANQKTNLSVAIFAMCYRNMLLFAYNIVIIAGVFLWFGVWPSWRIIYFLPALALTMTFLFSIAFTLGIVCARYRDAIPLVNSVTQIAYFVTPVLWKPDFLPADYQWINLVNPFAVFLAILRDPILGSPVSDATWGVAGIYAAVALLLYFTMIARFRSRVIYWI